MQNKLEKDKYKETNKSQKYFACRHCGMYYGLKDLKDGKCPRCESDEALFCIEEENDN